MFMENSNIEIIGGGLFFTEREVPMGKKMDCGCDDFNSIMGNDRLWKVGDDPLQIHK